MFVMEDSYVADQDYLKCQKIKPIGKELSKVSREVNQKIHDAFSGEYVDWYSLRQVEPEIEFIYERVKELNGNSS